ncbi:MAG: type IV pilus modification protein PilV [Gammaproteobacteria bacterium HGW-Gammaproteobacteria-4]|jgi:type IV pilus assembly protein PilV|nr:MAG: type IV pilus modification protein PilV [Gammaproteobacteria bacterium HGW-Gammaproteobacteria-4]
MTYTDAARNHTGTRGPCVPTTQLGTTLIEVLIAVLVMGIGMLGIASLQATSLRNSQSSLERSQAVIASYAIIDAMRANRNDALAGAYNITNTCTVPAGGTLVANDLNVWLTGIQAGLGAGACGAINCAAANCTVTVTWDDSRATGGDTAQTVITQTQL